MYDWVVDDIDPLSISLKRDGSDSGYRIDYRISRWVPMSGFEALSDEKFENPEDAIKFFEGKLKIETSFDKKKCLRDMRYNLASSLYESLGEISFEELLDKLVTFDSLTEDNILSPSIETLEDLSEETYQIVGYITDRIEEIQKGDSDE